MTGNLGSGSSVRLVFLAIAMVTSSVAVHADTARATLDERIRGAESVVVASVRRVDSEWRQNSFGDRLIVSRIELAVDEMIKGTPPRTLLMEMEGGSLDGVTLRVSTLPLIQEPGERAVFFLNPSARGVYAPYLNGQGILFLGAEDVIKGSALRLDDIRGRARALAQGR